MARAIFQLPSGCRRTTPRNFPLSRFGAPPLVGVRTPENVPRTKADSPPIRTSSTVPVHSYLFCGEPKSGPAIRRAQGIFQPTDLQFDLTGTPIKGRFFVPHGAAWHGPFGSRLRRTRTFGPSAPPSCSPVAQGPRGTQPRLPVRPSLHGPVPHGSCAQAGRPWPERT